MGILIDSVNAVLNEGLEFNSPVCNDTISNEQTQKVLEDILSTSIENDGLISFNHSRIRIKSYGNIKISENNSIEQVARYEDGLITLMPNKTIKPIKAFYSIGITYVSIYMNIFIF